MREDGAVEASLRYLDPDKLGPAGAKPKVYSASHPKLPLRAVRVRICNSRAQRHELSLDRQGFVLVDHRSAVADFEDTDEVRRVYPAEIEQLIRDLVGASLVGVLPVFFVRNGVKLSTPKTPPVHFAHSDYSDTSAPQLARTSYFHGRQLPPGRRIAGFNIWRAISPPPQNVPLAVCDDRSIAPADRVLGVIDATCPPEKQFDSVLFVHNPAHRWHYFRNMTRDEVLIFKSWDSDRSRPQFVAHTAFVDSGCPHGTPGRVSIEARAFACF